MPKCLMCRCNRVSHWQRLQVTAGGDAGAPAKEPRAGNVAPNSQLASLWGAGGWRWPLSVVKGNVSRHKLSFPWCGGGAGFHGVVSRGLVAVATEGDGQISHPFTFSSPAKKPEPCPAGAAFAVAACPDGWIGYLGKCYYFSQAEGNWTYSQKNCSALGASLAGIYTQQEMDFLMRYKGPSDHWIGLGREPGQPWMWTSGKEFNNWFKIKGRGLCAFANNGDIASSGCSRDAPWICSKATEKPAGRAK
nr:early activation antigen CD69-like isoform X3 [Chelonoidis abingdonii]